MKPTRRPRSTVPSRSATVQRAQQSEYAQLHPLKPMILYFDSRAVVITIDRAFHPVMLRPFLILILSWLGCGLPGDINDVIPRNGFSLGTVLVSTIDGQLSALDTESGETKWTLQGEPVLRSPTVVKQGFTFLPNPRDGSLYTLKEGILKRLPLSIPALVHASPLRSSDGVLYAGQRLNFLSYRLNKIDSLGSKKDVWLEINPLTGAKVETMSSATDRVCPANNHNGIFVGKTEYRISMFDTKSRGKTWNTTFSDYSAHLLPGCSCSTVQVLLSSLFVSFSVFLKVF
ncbi:unnamed protein product [Angiostrongylus costaricensis]|uniref:PQQ_3 domain-containing protein n=1 Tax=Angiostrongylus costaricensis TaxID=334426 RepID=A0A0R3PMF4_ANGCS|nr:unnamed protein product [Angiostrongylus costaricensis]